MGETIYVLANASVMPFWVLMMFAPKSRLAERLFSTPLVPAVFALFYTGLLLASFVVGEGGDMFSLDGLRLAFTRDVVLLLAWVHYLCFDMVVGLWEWRDAKRLDLPWVWVAPCMLFTLLFGPLGFLCYVVFRKVRVGHWAWDVDSVAGPSK